MEQWRSQVRLRPARFALAAARAGLGPASGAKHPGGGNGKPHARCGMRSRRDSAEREDEAQGKEGWQAHHRTWLRLPQKEPMRLHARER